MITRRHFIGASFVVLIATTSFGAEPRKVPPPLGLNLAGVTDWSSEIVFVDVFKASRMWISQQPGKPWGRGPKLDLDAKGNLRSLKPGQYAETVVFTDFSDRFPAGTYTCLYDGSGRLDFTSDAKVVKRTPGKLKVDIKPRNGSTFCRITQTDPKNPLRNIRLIMPGHEKSYLKQPFNPDFLKRWRGFRGFRFMDWGRTNGSKIAKWADRPTPDFHSQAVRGVAAEYMIQHSNVTGADPWFCMPHLADDDYVRRFAELVKKRLDPKRKILIEYSNECWNGQFAQARYCRDQGRKLALSDNSYEGQLRYYSQRSVEIFKIWEQVFGGKDRLVSVLAAQSANPWTGKTVLEWNSAAKSADAIAIAPYFGHRWGNPRTAEKVAGMTADTIIKGLRDDLKRSRKNMDDYAAVAKRYGLKLLAYEGGQHVVGYGGAENNRRLAKLFHAVNRHPGMKELYLQNLRDWQAAGGDLFVVFSSMGRYSKWGSWGLLESARQEAKDAPKYQAIVEYLKRSSRGRR